MDHYSQDNKTDMDKRSDEGMTTELRRVDSIDPVFGEVEQGGITYTTVGWVSTSVLLMKTQIGLGVLSIPHVISVLGFIPGVIAIIGIAAITTFSDLELGVFRARHPECYSLSDVGFILGGRWGREFLGGIYWIFMVATVGSAFIGISTALNAVTQHGTCTAVFIGVVAASALVLASIRTLEKISWISWVGLASILSAIMTVTVAVGVQERPSLAPAGPWEKDLRLVGDPSFTDAMTAIAGIVFALAGTPAFLPIAAEMKNRHDYAKATMLCQSVVVSLYLTIGIVVYYYCGQYVSSPALGSASELVKRVAYGLALPGLLASMTIYTHLPAKWLMMRFLRGSRHLTANSPRHWITWLSCVASCVIIAYLLASAVPAFNSIVGLVGALLGTIVSMQTMALMWLHDYNLDRRAGMTVKHWGASLCWAIFAIGSFILVGGTYASIKGIVDTYADGAGRVWSCDDNSTS